MSSLYNPSRRSVIRLRPSWGRRRCFGDASCGAALTHAGWAAPDLPAHPAIREATSLKTLFFRLN